MVGKGSSEDQSIPVNATTILAVLTLLGGLLLVTNKLSSDRPVVPSGEANPDISEQQVDTWLWEDPFGRSSFLERTNNTLLTNKLVGNLAGEIASGQNANFHLIAVMIPGGPASEDRELRLRNRFAIVSALAESAYAPRHRAQIGIGAMTWPSTLELSTNMPYTIPERTQFSHRDFSNNMYYAFEWYDRERFLQYRPGRSTNDKPVLVLWLDEDQFGDYPVPRIDLLLRRLGDTDHDKNETWLGPNGTFLTNHDVALIGPGRSDTLKAMFPDEFAPGKPEQVKNVCNYLTTNVTLFLAVPRAAEQMLVRTKNYAESAPRQALLEKLTNFFHEVKNVGVTDPDLAREVFAELKLRGVDLAETNNHLVLIGGWDEYFGRMLSVAYASELSELQTWSSRDQFFAENQGNQIATNLWPSNLHTFLYLSGLDGQGLSGQTKENQRQDYGRANALNGDSGQEKPPRWTPEEDGAEGPAQFDYLGRLAGRIQDLDDGLQRQGRGRVKAIGIGGGDTYDTLLILQALRPRFPEVLFFTTQLDARFWDSKEWPWSRNLIVVSGYGLSLNEETIQVQTAPFRDSQQTAQFAAALSALGNTNIPNLTGTFPVRRFEIGRKGPVDLPASESSMNSPLHPKIDRSYGVLRWFSEVNRWPAILAVLLCTTLILVCLSPGFRRFTVSRQQFLAEPLWLREEDIGGLEGFIEMAIHLGNLPSEADLQSAPPQEGKLTENARKARLARTISAKIKSAELETERVIQESCAESIFSEEDVLEPGALVNILNGKDDCEPKGFTAESRAERRRLALALRNALPARAKACLAERHGYNRNLSAFLEELIKALRVVINTVDLSEGGAQTQTTSSGTAAEPQKKPSPLLWRRNRELLCEPFAGVLQPPVSLSSLLFTGYEKPEAAIGDLHQDVEQRRKHLLQAIRAPERRDCLRSAMLMALDCWNAHWLAEFTDSPCKPAGTARESEAFRALVQTIPHVESRDDLNCLMWNRDQADELIKKLLRGGGKDNCHANQPESEESCGFKKAAEAARSVSRDLYHECSDRWHRLKWIGIAAIVSGFCMFLVNLHDTASWPWKITGASVWPSNWLYLLAVVLGCLFMSESYFQLRTTFLETTRRCRLDYHRAGGDIGAGQRTQQQSFRSWVRQRFYPSTSEPVAVVYADAAWAKYQMQGRGWHRLCRSVFFATLYLFIILGVYQLAFGHQYHLFLRAPGRYWYEGLVWAAFSLFLLLCFWTIDAAVLCRWFILRISQGPTLYSLATRRHFSRQRGQVSYHVLSEWIDVSVIAEITERVGMLIYFPAALFLLIIVGNNNLFYYFPWPPVYYVLVMCNLGVAAVSIVILQRAARRARDQSMDVLEQKLNQLKAGTVVTEAQKKQHDITETEALLAEIRAMKKGAFGGFWSNPVLGALLVPSGGTALIEIIQYFVK